MAITPNTDLYLLDSPLESDNLNQLTFSNIEAQTNYFKSLDKVTEQNFTYQRHNNVIRYPAHIDSINTYNYVMYKNNNYLDKWFYAFVVKMEYVNDNMTNIYIKNDVYQTWMFDIVYKKCFVEREHVNDDTIGKHTIPEGLETGEYIVNGEPYKLDFLNSRCIILGVSDNYNDIPLPPSGLINGIYSGLQYEAYSTSQDGINALNSIIEEYQSGKSEAIYSLFMAPTWLIPGWSSSTISKSIDSSNVPITEVINLAPNYVLNGYNPKNNKVKCFPYNYLLISNNNGMANTYKYELFEKDISNNLQFKLNGVVTTGCSIRLNPLSYNCYGLTSSIENYEEGINLGKYSTCSWNCDSYTNWLTQNAVNTSLSTLGGIVATGVGLATNNLISTASGVLSIAQSLGSIYEHSLVPDIAKGNINNGDVATASDNCNFTFYKMSIKYEYAKMIDDFMSMYGYKVNSLKVPNVTGRRTWNYVKTIGANIQGIIPMEDIEELKQIFDNGVTFWHNPSTYLDYSQNNGII